MLGATHPFTLNMATKVATVLKDNGQIKKALDVCRTYTKSYHAPPRNGADDAGFVPCRLEVSALFILRSKIHLDKNEFAEAKHDLEKALSVYSMHNNVDEGVEDTRVASLWGNLANICGAMDEHQEALDYYNKALGVFREQAKTDPKQVCTTLLNIALSNRHVSKFEEALRAAEEARRAEHEATKRELANYEKEFAQLTNQAQTIKGLNFDRFQAKSLRDIWYDGEAFNAFRGFDWNCASRHIPGLVPKGARRRALPSLSEADAIAPGP